LAEMTLLAESDSARAGSKLGDVDWQEAPTDGEGKEDGGCDSQNTRVGRNPISSSSLIYPKVLFLWLNGTFLLTQESTQRRVPQWAFFRERSSLTPCDPTPSP